MEQFEGTEIAIIGMAGRFPGAHTLEQFWQNLRDGVESIRFLTDVELRALGVSSTTLDDPSYVKAAAAMDDMDLFDAAFFGISHREAELIDPQHRIFLECAWEALERAGYIASPHDCPIGVFAGASTNTYLLYNLLSNHTVRMLDPVQIDIASSGDFLTTRVSYKFDLKGPSHFVQSACSTSLVAIHIACQSLLNEECDIAVSGGVTANVTHPTGYRYIEGGIASPDGHCRPFAADSRGTIFSSGAGVVVLKRLEDALADNDTILALIRGSAINNDGAHKVGYTAPSVEGQAEVVAEALANAGVDPHSITYIETHGTGTPLGDPIELQALTKAFRSTTSNTRFCGIGSVKSNLGHLGAAAGVCSLIKAVLALQHGEIPPSLHFEHPNPDIDFANTPFYVNTKLRPWPVHGAPRRAGVSSFGVGGTNAHVVVEEAPNTSATSPGRSWQVLLLSAKTATALNTATTNLAEYLHESPDVNLADVSYTLQIGRRHFDHRRVVICQDRDDAIHTLETLDPQHVLSTVIPSDERPVVFLFPGQGAQYVSMAQELYETEPIFRTHVDHCARLLSPYLKLDLRKLLYPEESDREEAIRQLAQTAITQSTLFVIEYALAQLWMTWGVYPDAMIGHSVGEYVAACLAGVFTLEDALMLVALRGQLMQDLPGGAMLAVRLPAEQLEPMLDDTVSLAAINSPMHCVVSGTHTAVSTLQERLAGQQIECQMLHISHAFHSSMMIPILARFADQVRRVQRNAPRIRYISNVTGTWVTPEQATDPYYWARHIRETVRFADGIDTLLKDSDSILLEVGPGPTLGRLVRQHTSFSSDRVVLSSLRHVRESQSDMRFWWTTLAQLWLAGGTINWADGYAQEQRRRIPLPTYPFERRRYWIEPDQSDLAGEMPPTDATKKTRTTDWLYLPTWQQTTPLRATPLSTEAHDWLVFVDSYNLGAALIERLRSEEQLVTLVKTGEGFCQNQGRDYSINPTSREDYQRLCEHLQVKGIWPTHVVHLASLSGDDETVSQQNGSRNYQTHGFYSLLFLAQALATYHEATPITITVVSNGVAAVTGAESLIPDKSLLLGITKVIPQEFPHIICRCIDMLFPHTRTLQAAQLVEQILATTQATKAPAQMALRGAQCWIPLYDALQVVHDPVQTFRQNGVYLITNGLIAHGYALAEHLIQSVQARLVLIESADFPLQDEWQTWLATHSHQETTSRKIHNLQRLQSISTNVLIYPLSLTDQVQLRRAIDDATTRFGALHGVIHAAGTSSGQSFKGIRELHTSDCIDQFLPRLDGVYALAQVLADRELDFIVLMSSLATVLGGIGYAAYASANSFMDAFAHQQHQHGDQRWMSINWDAWRFDDEQAQITSISSDLAQLALTVPEGIAALESILAHYSASQVIVSTGDLATRMSQGEQKIVALRGQYTTTPAQRHPRPPLSTPYVPPTNDFEQKIATVWEQELGLEQIGVHDNFFDLGGDSFIAIHVIAQLGKELDMDIPAVSLYEGLTVRSFAEIVRSSLLPPQDVVQVEHREEKANRRKDYQRMQRVRKRGEQ